MGQQNTTPEQRLAYLENLIHTQGVIINELREALTEQGIEVNVGAEARVAAATGSAS